MKKCFYILFATLLTLMTVSLAGCNDENFDPDPEAVKITIDGTDVAYQFNNTDGDLIWIDFTTSPTDFTGELSFHTLSIDLGENPVLNISLDRSFWIENDSLFDLKIPYSQDISLRDGHWTISYTLLKTAAASPRWFLLNDHI